MMYNSTLELNKLYNSDCLEIMKDMPDNSVDLILTDPPYLIDYQSNHRKNKFDKIENDADPEFIKTYISECYRILKNNRAAYIFTDYKTYDFFKPIFENSGFKLKNALIWVKNNWGGGDLEGAYGHRYEMIMYGHKGRRLLTGKRYDDVLYFNRIKPGPHPTEKPIDLLEYLIINSTEENEIVFDGCAGVGTSLIAAINTNRKYIGVEIKDLYYNEAQKRLSNHNLQMRLF